MFKISNFSCFFSATVLISNEFILKNKMFSLNCANFLKNSIFYKLNNLVDIICVDYVDCKKRFKLVYIMQSYFYKKKFMFYFSFFFFK